MIRRRAEKEINAWLEAPKQALLVSGARQVGKTFSIRRCLQEANRDYVEINLVEQPEMVRVLERTTSVDDLIINLSTATNHSFLPGETILFIDEVQEARDIVTRMKFWVDDGRFSYVLSGSLLGIELRSLRSAPVGYLREITMFPLDFEEFLRASGVTDEVMDFLRGAYEKRKPCSDLVHDRMMEHFRRYLVVGGMPAAVQEYLETGDINKVTVIQRSIIELYKQDFTKYEEENRKLRIISIYETMPSQLLKQNRRFLFSDIQKGLRFEQLQSSFLWLAGAGVVIATYNATEPRVSLKQNQKSSLLKLYSSDVGLLTSQYGNALRTKILIGDEKVNLGGIYENAVAQELHAHGYDTYFYNSHRIGELDFLIEEDASVIPIEVKSGKDYYVHSAMDRVCSNEEYEIEKAYVLTNYNLAVSGKLHYLPVYMATFIRDDTRLPVLAPLA